MNEIPEGLRLYRSQLRDAIERDLHRRTPRPRMLHPRAARLLPTFAVLAAATVAVFVGLMLRAASPPSAYAAASKAIAATSAGSVDSGTMSQTFVLGNHTTHGTTQWSGNDISISADDGSLFGARQVLLIDGAVYAQQADGTWLHYASESDAGRLALLVQSARVDVAGSSAAQILAVVPDLQKATQPDGSTVFTGTILASGPAHVTPTDDTATRLAARLKSVGRDARFKLVVGRDGLVSQMSETADDGTFSWSVQYSQLGSTTPISPPATSTDATPATAPAITPTETTAPEPTAPVTRPAP
jgi:hypothetical protein